MSEAAQRKGRLPGWGMGLIGVGLVMAIGLVVVIILGDAATARWERYAVKLRAGGDPLTFEEIEDRRATVSDAANGARVLERLFGELNSLPTDTRENAHVLGSARAATWPTSSPAFPATQSSRRSASLTHIAIAWKSCTR